MNARLRESYGSRGISEGEGPDRPGQEGDLVRVLVVEDERVLADAIATGLRRQTLAVDVAYAGAGAL